jgi:HK97 family phage major capsid protein
VIQAVPRSAAHRPAHSSRRDGQSFGDFLRTVKGANDPWRAETRHAAQARLEKVYGAGYVTKTAMSEDSGQGGGYLVPLEYSIELLKVVAEESFIFPRARQIPMAAAETLCPVVSATQAQAAGTAPYFGGALFTWGSSQAPSETEPTFRQLSLKAWDLLGYSVASNQLLADVSDEGEDALVRVFGQAASWYSEYAFLQGTGSARQMPQGVVNAPAALKVSRASPGTIGVADVANLATGLLPYCWRHAVWACHPSALTKIMQIGSFFLNGDPDLADGGMAGMLVGRPVFVTDKLPALGSAGDLVFFDPSLYVIGLRQEVLVDVSTHANFATNQTVFRVWLRLDGRPQLDGVVTLADGTKTASAYVVLVA